MYISVGAEIFLVARKENLTGVSTALAGRSKNLHPTGFHLCTKEPNSRLGTGPEITSLFDLGVVSA